MIFFLIGLFVLLVFILFTGIRIVPQAHEYVVEFLGKYKTTWAALGIHFLVPFFERIAKKITLKEQVLDSPPQPVITKDNVTMQIDTVVYLQSVRRKAIYLWRGQPDERAGKPDRYHSAKLSG